jgi:hypothetical protein
MAQSHHSQIRWQELSEDHRRRLSERVYANVGTNADPEAWWAGMPAPDQHQWVWREDHPDENLDAYRAEVARLDQLTRVNGKPPPEYDLEAPSDEDRRDFAAQILVEQRHMTPGEVEALAPPEWLIDNWLVRNTLALLWGEWNAGKSFLALTLAGYIGSGSWWLGREVARAKVLYVAGEGVAGLGPRIKAFKTGHKLWQMNGVGFYKGRIDLLDPLGRAVIDHLIADHGYELIVWDTLARMVPGVEENSAKEVGAIVDVLDDLREQGCGSLALHHGTADGHSARGFKAYLGACDTELELRADGAAMTLSCLQQRDGERPEAIKLWRELIPNTGSCTVVDGIGKASNTRSPTEQKVLDELTANPTMAYSRGDMAAVVGCSESGCNRALLALAKEGICSRLRRGSGYEYALL